MSYGKGMSLFILVLCLIFWAMKSANDDRYNYVKTSIGAIKSDFHPHPRCLQGFVFVNEYDLAQFIGADGKPITCTGYIRLNEKEFNEYGK